MKKIDINTAYLIKLLLRPNPMASLMLDNPAKFPGKLVEDFTGVSERTIKNYIRGRHSIAKTTASTITSRLSRYFNRIHGTKFDSQLFENLLMSGRESFLKKLDSSNLIKDEFSTYYSMTAKFILSFHIQLSNLYKDQCHSKADEISLRRLLKHIINCDLPNEMVENEHVNFKNLNDFESNIIINNYIIFLKLDFMLYELSAYDVEYNYHFLRDINGFKSIGIRYLPYEDKKGIKNSIAIYFERVMKQLKERPEYEIHTLYDLAEKISENQSEKTDIDSVIRQIKRWKNGKTIPKGESMDKIFVALAKIQCEKDSTLQTRIKTSADPKKEKYETEEYCKEQSRIFFRYVIIFQRILNAFNDSALSNESIVSFFERYYYWHNYHTVKFYEARK